ncbi:MAG: hypothetical protein JJU29_20340 [Verrucomicrobia bacterium]|nr:hypothetical protein [Verrucomicrobiota bacterium]MCH8512754.1 hypothetical protein [Kiritimatiellia bacterium]
MKLPEVIEAYIKKSGSLPKEILETNPIDMKIEDKEGMINVWRQRRHLAVVSDNIDLQKKSKDIERFLMRNDLIDMIMWPSYKVVFLYSPKTKDFICMNL